MSMLLCIQSHYGKPGILFREAGARSDAVVVNQSELDGNMIDEAGGLITTMHLDQDGLMAHADRLEALMDRGGRWFFNGHIMRPFLEGLGTYQPIKQAGRDDLTLTPLASHRVFADVDRDELGARKGVSGFYGRGHNPMPERAEAVTGIGPGHLPVDWDWHRPGGGRFFSHAGNDLPGASEKDKVAKQLADNIIAWTAGEEEEGR